MINILYSLTINESSIVTPTVKLPLSSVILDDFLFFTNSLLLVDVLCSYIDEYCVIPIEIVISIIRKSKVKVRVELST